MLNSGHDTGYTDVPPTETLRGADPFLTGVPGGSDLSNSSGLRFAPNDTLLRLLGAATAGDWDFLFLPVKIK